MSSLADYPGSPDGCNEQKMKDSRSESFDSIPEAGFIKQTLKQEMEAGGSVIISEFKKKELRGELKPEPLLAEDKSRFVLFPIKNTDVSLFLSFIGKLLLLC